MIKKTLLVLIDSLVLISLIEKNYIVKILNYERFFAISLTFKNIEFLMIFLRLVCLNYLFFGTKLYYFVNY